jgi:uncharacterized Zn finger protein (UPF0148 family)
VSEHCASCGAVLSRYNDDTPCAACARSQPTPQVPDPERLLCAVAAALFGRPSEPVYLQEALAEQGVYADHVDVQHAISKLRRRGVEIEAEPRKAGYRLIGWSRAFAWHRRRRS